MSAAPSRPGFISLDEYVRLAEQSADKLDYIDGRIVNVSELIAMSGGSVAHSLVISNLIREAGNRLKGKPCRAYESNLRLGSGRDAFLHYPDLSVVCGELKTDPRDRTGQTCINPTVVVEVLSPSTWPYDFGEKFRRYRQIESFREYWLVRQDQAEITTYLRRDDGAWLFRFFSGTAGDVPMESVGVALSLAEIYDGIVFPPAEATPPADRTD